MSTLDQRLAGCRVVICAGAGGVGKTTLSAAMAMALAERGARVAVVTIDPARRLAQALGLDALENDPVRVDPEVLSRGGVELRGELWAMMLDAKRTFDDLIARLAPDARTRDDILANEIYRQLSGAVAGSQEYTAIAKLYDLVHDGGFDVIVLDTPPSRNALEFLDAPGRLTAFLEGRALRAFLAPAGLARLMSGGASAAFAVLRRLTGVNLLEDLSVFFRQLSGLTDGLRDRASDVDALFHDPATRFVVVTSPGPGPVNEAVFLARRLGRAGLPSAAIIVNRVHPLDRDERSETETAARLAAELGPDLARRVARTHAELQVLARREAAAISRLRRTLAEDDPVLVPDLEEDIHDVRGLATLRDRLFG